MSTSPTRSGFTEEHAKLLGQVITTTAVNAEQITSLTTEVRELTKQVTALAITQAAATEQGKSQAAMITSLITRMDGMEQRERNTAKERLTQVEDRQETRGNNLTQTIVQVIIALVALLALILSFVHHA